MVLRATSSVLQLRSRYSVEFPVDLFDPSLSAGAGFGQWFTGVAQNFEWAASVDPRI